MQVRVSTRGLDLTALKLLPRPSTEEKSTEDENVPSPIVTQSLRPKYPMYLPPFRLPQPKYPPPSSFRNTTPSPKTPLPFRMVQGLHNPLPHPPPAPDWFSTVITPRERRAKATPNPTTKLPPKLHPAHLRDILPKLPPAHLRGIPPKLPPAHLS